MGLGELISRISSSGAEGAVVISTWKGNPGDLSFLSLDGREILVLRVESAMLRREVSGATRIRVSSMGGVLVASGSRPEVVALGERLAKLLRTDSGEAEEPPVGRKAGEVVLWLESLPSGKTIWTHYHSLDGAEIGPRVRFKSIRRGEGGSES
jgi:rRNA maturation protein Rpf1